MGDTDSEASNLQKMKHLKDLSPDERKLFLDSFDRVFCDCDGVVWQTSQSTIPGAGEAISYLQSLGKDVVFVTNNSLRLVEDHLAKLQENGITTTKERLISPAQTVISYLYDLKFEGTIYCVASTPFKKMLTTAGFSITDGPNRMLDETLQDLCANVFPTDKVKAVVIDVDFNLSVAKLMRAHRYLTDRECLFLAGAADRLIPLSSKEIIGVGPFIDILEQAAKRKATVLGKPGKDLCDFLKKHCNVVDPGRALFIGDMLGSDVKFGKMAGFQTVLVLTEWTKKNELQEELTEDEMPDYCVDSLADFNDFV